MLATTCAVVAVAFGMSGAHAKSSGIEIGLAHLNDDISRLEDMMTLSLEEEVEDHSQQLCPSMSCNAKNGCSKGSYGCFNDADCCIDWGDRNLLGATEACVDTVCQNRNAPTDVVDGSAPAGTVMANSDKVHKAGRYVEVEADHSQHKTGFIKFEWTGFRASVSVTPDTTAVEVNVLGKARFALEATDEQGKVLKYGGKEVSISFRNDQAECSHKLSLPAGREGTTVVTLTKVSETFGEATFPATPGKGPIILRSFKATGGDFGPTPRPKGPKMEFYGDSDSAAYGILHEGGMGFGRLKEMDYEDVRQGWAYKVARKLDADATMMFESGIGVDKKAGQADADGMLDEALRILNFASTHEVGQVEAPDFTMVLLGPNDLVGDVFSNTDFSKQYTQLIKKIKGHYKNCDAVKWVFVVGGSCLKQATYNHVFDMVQKGVEGAKDDLGSYTIVELGWDALKRCNTDTGYNFHFKPNCHTWIAQKVLQEMTKNWGNIFDRWPNLDTSELGADPPEAMLP